MRSIILLILALLFPGCAFNVAWRGTLTYVEQEATTGGKVDSRPTARDTSISAEKTTDLKADVPITR